MAKHKEKRKGFRDGVSKEDIVNLSVEEKQRIKDMRQLMDAPVGSLSYKIFLYSDQVRRMIRERKNTTKKRLWNIEDLGNQILRLKNQIDSEKITETLKDGMTMTPDEVRTSIKHRLWIRDGEAENIPYLLAETRSFVDHKDVAGNIIMSLGEFDKYARFVLNTLRGCGYEILGKD